MLSESFQNELQCTSFVVSNDTHWRNSLLTSTRQKWQQDSNVQQWLEARYAPRTTGNTKDNNLEWSVSIWLQTLEIDTWGIDEDLPNNCAQAIQYIKSSKPNNTWNWHLDETLQFNSRLEENRRLVSTEMYVHWWCYCREYVHNKYVHNKNGQRYIYPTLDSYNRGRNARSLFSAEMEVVILLTDWLVKLNNDRLMYLDAENSPGVPRIQTDDNGSVCIGFGEYPGWKTGTRHATGQYLMKQGELLSQERGGSADYWNRSTVDINWYTER
tara:strand:- start:35 stop:844 length:810 start_codon:yes stop_codon:yes gene_type:complete